VLLPEIRVAEEKRKSGSAVAESELPVQLTLGHVWAEGEVLHVEEGQRVFPADTSALHKFAVFFALLVPVKPFSSHYDGRPHTGGDCAWSEDKLGRNGSQSLHVIFRILTSVLELL